MSPDQPIQTPLKDALLREYLDDFLLVAFAVSKVLVAALLLSAFIWIPSRANLWNRFYTQNERTLYTPFSNWDGQHFLLLAERGYSDPSVRYFVGCHPLFPLSIALTNTIALNPYLSALTNVTLFSFLFLWMFYAYAQRYLGAGKAKVAVILLLLYPSAMFLTVTYSESLFLLCLFAFLVLYGRRHWGAVVFAVLLPLAKAQGLLVACAFVVGASWQNLRIGKFEARFELRIMAGFVTGFVLGGLFYRMTTGNFWAGLEAQKYFVAEARATRVLAIPQFFQYLLSSSSSWFAYNNGRLDKVFVVLLLAGIPVVMSARVPLHICLYSILVYVPAAMGIGAMSFARYSLAAIPFLLVSMLQICGPQKACRVLFVCLGVLFFVVQVVFVVRFALNLWVG